MDFPHESSCVNPFSIIEKFSVSISAGHRSPIYPASGYWIYLSSLIQEHVDHLFKRSGWIAMSSRATD